MKENKNRFAAVNSVYLIPQAEGQWTACVAPFKPDPKALKLCKEKNYPVSMFYCRYDINGSSVFEEDICKNREELLTALNWSGQCGHTIRDLWDFQFIENKDPTISELFADAYNALMEKIREDGPYAEAESDSLDIAYEAIEVLDSILQKPNGEELFQLASICYNLSDVAKEADLPFLARKILDARLSSSAAFTLDERVDAVRTLLDFGMSSNRSPEFPEASPAQMREILLSCDLDVFKEIVDSVALDNQSFYVPDNDYSLEAQKSRDAAIDYITNGTQKKTSLADKINDAAIRADSTTSGVAEKEGLNLSNSRE